MRLKRFGWCAATAAVACVATACGPNTDAYAELQSSMKSSIGRTDRPVASVSCTPHVKDTVREEIVHLRCLVVFKDGTSYTANATIQNQNDGGRHNMPDRYTWDNPPSS